MILIETTTYAEKQIDDIYANNRIYNGIHFTQEFLNWNSEFHRYVNEKTISKQKLSSNGWYKIGSIGTLEYQCFHTNDAIVFVILEFRFTKLPYTTRKARYSVVGDAGYGYKVIQSTFNEKYALLTPQRRYLTKFVFDNIINFHHSSDDYNTIYAVGFIGDRVYAIYQDGNIQVLPYSKDEYLNKTHKYYESKKHTKGTIILNEVILRKIVCKVLQEVLSA